MSRLKRNEFWAVVWPDGCVDINTASYRRGDAIMKFSQPFLGSELAADWRAWRHKHGVRVARVRVEVLER